MSRQMPEYLPSLQERKRRLIEYCCGGDDMPNQSIDTGEPPTAESETSSLIDRTLNTLKDKRKKRRNKNGP